MINISQHCFMPRTKTLNGYYTLSGVYTSHKTYLTTEMQTGDVYNCFQLFGSYIASGAGSSKRYVLRLFPSGSDKENYVGNGYGYISPTLEKKSTVYTSSAFTFDFDPEPKQPNLPNGLIISSIMWFE